MSNNPHLDMANDVASRMFPKLIDPAQTAAKIVEDYAKTDPIAELETSEGLLGLQSDNCDIDASESVYFRLTDAQIEEGNLTAERL